MDRVILTRQTVEIIIIIIIIMGYIFATILSQNKSDKTKDVSRWYIHINDHNGSKVFFKNFVCHNFCQYCFTTLSFLNSVILQMVFQITDISNLMFCQITFKI